VTVQTNAAPAIAVRDVSKAFRVPHEHMHTLKERALHPFRGRSFDRFEALKDVSFAVRKGEFFGIVGRNGSGKSTLLKCIAGIYGADEGAIYVDGSVSTFIELGVGFNPELAARDNVVLNAIMMGVSPAQARRTFDEVIQFAELEEFVDLKLKNYSSGMHVRLAFSVMIQVNADIMLIDEVLAVGDVAFQQKCYDAFNRLRDEGRTIVLVTHDMSAINRFCHRALLLERGEVVIVDEPASVGAQYVALNMDRGQSDERATGEPSARSRPEANIIDAWFETEEGERVGSVPQGASCSFKIRTVFKQQIENPSFTMVIEDDRSKPLFAGSSLWKVETTGAFAAGEEVTVAFSFENPFTPGRYFATAAVSDKDNPTAWLDRRERIASLIVSGYFHSGGQVDLPHDFTIERIGAAERQA
jgi:ABC-type polysaccharide/polyol phosphate transport system ATPase subunit